jgi:hypothetical protein
MCYKLLQTQDSLTLCRDDTQFDWDEEYFSNIYEIAYNLNR